MNAKLGLFECGSLVLVRAITPVHMGVGRAGGVVDLPVQRDVYGFPSCSSSGVKGAIRASFTDGGIVDAIFGPRIEGGAGEENYYAGAFNTLDMRLLLFPVRSLRGVYAFATCPLLLNVFMSYLEVAEALKVDVKNLKGKVSGLVKMQPKEDEVITESDQLAINDKAVLNEEFILKIKKESRNELTEFSRELGLDSTYSGRLVIVHDDVAAGLVERSIQKISRVKLEKDIKKVARGGLWTEENVPSDTVFHTVFMYSKTRGGNVNMSASEVKNFIENEFNSRSGYLVIGGNETVGRGLVRLIFIKQVG